ncbi:MAG TPA: PilN domain-containing protein [Solirubrobacterales bacterium]|nr:PilN domain-containing protein [Solirubrobacterales bacterium]
MRPVNLIPTDERRGENAPLRTGPIAYVVVGALVAVLAGITALVLTGNQIADREAEVARLEREDSAAAARAQRLAAFTQFQTLHAQRVATVTSLADSRFDWERVMRELSLVLPGNVWLVSLNATASPSATAEGSSSGSSGGSSGASGLRAAAPGPALEISGCASGQEAVAGFVTALKDIDGVTRVGVQSSQLADESAAGASAGDAASSGDDCRTRAFIAKFEIVVAFDAAPVPITSDAAAVTATAPVTSPTETTTSTGG